jgi:hypothetical protein
MTATGLYVSSNIFTVVIDNVRLVIFAPFFLLVALMAQHNILDTFLLKPLQLIFCHPDNF